MKETTATSPVNGICQECFDNRKKQIIIEHTYCHHNKTAGFHWKERDYWTCYSPVSREFFEKTKNGKLTEAIYEAYSDTDLAISPWDSAGK